VIEVNSDFAAMTGARWKSATKTRVSQPRRTPRLLRWLSTTVSFFSAIAVRVVNHVASAPGRRAGSARHHAQRGAFALRQPVTLDSMDRIIARCCSGRQLIVGKGRAEARVIGVHVR